MYVEGLKLVNFKNYENQTLEFSPKLNCFVGDNGMGKTNLLDALHYLSMSKSHYSLPDKSVVRHGEDFFRLEGLFNRKTKKEKIVCKYKHRSKKVIERNKVEYKKFADHIGFLPLVMVCPDDSSLITGGSEIRRQYIDLLLVQIDPSYLNHLMYYNKVLLQRNSFLKQYTHPSEIDFSLLQVYDHQLIEPAQYIHEKRKSGLKRLKPVFHHYYKIISGNKEKVDFEYFSFLNEHPLVELLNQSKEKDVWLQRTTKGIHKDDLKLMIDDYSVKKIASQGQLKSYLLALKLAQYELLREESEVTPLLLLDDIFDKLDNKRVKQLLELLVSCDFGQIFITDTHKSRILDIVKSLDTDYSQFIVSNGSVLIDIQ